MRGEVNLAGDCDESALYSIATPAQNLFMIVGGANENEVER